MAEILPFAALDPSRFERPDVLKKVTAASRRLAELKGVAASIPNEAILINTLGLQEAKDSSAIENIVTTHDELFREAAFPESGSAASKEVAHYRRALRIGFEAVTATGLLTNNHILEIQSAARAEHGRISQARGHRAQGERRPCRLHAAARSRNHPHAHGRARTLHQ